MSSVELRFSGDTHGISFRLSLIFEQNSLIPISLSFLPPFPCLLPPFPISRVDPPSFPSSFSSSSLLSSFFFLLSGLTCPLQPSPPPPLSQPLLSAAAVSSRRSLEVVLLTWKFGQQIDEHVQKEIMNHRSLKHPNIIRFKKVVLTPTHLAIVMEYVAEGEIFERICNAGRFSEGEVT
ncbi:uncharacterized protein LOC131148219 [Malania oleifera]|uniref:uncharacterized protein LOC131148219 n=1 Tax=Malania oleifera TaxID=397392 RepID=UPI0025AE1715|nr:uncharacterized protein LOC131148219 [Malania oleifera]